MVPHKIWARTDLAVVFFGYKQTGKQGIYLDIWMTVQGAHSVLLKTYESKSSRNFRVSLITNGRSCSSMWAFLFWGSINVYPPRDLVDLHKLEINVWSRDWQHKNSYIRSLVGTVVYGVLNAVWGSYCRLHICI